MKLLLLMYMIIPIFGKRISILDRKRLCLPTVEHPGSEKIPGRSGQLMIGREGLHKYGDKSYNI